LNQTGKAKSFSKVEKNGEVNPLPLNSNAVHLSKNGWGVSNTPMVNLARLSL